MTSRVLGIAVASALALAVPAWAHHSHVHYEKGETITVSGIVTEIQWINPHTWFFITVTGEDGQAQEWALESGAPSQLIRRGWVRERIEPGDTITALVRPVRGGSNGGLLGTIILSDGTRFCDPFDAAPLDAVCED